MSFSGLDITDMSPIMILLCPVDFIAYSALVIGKFTGVLPVHESENTMNHCFPTRDQLGPF
jgi:hypothetical protein